MDSSLKVILSVFTLIIDVFESLQHCIWMDGKNINSSHQHVFYALILVLFLHVVFFMKQIYKRKQVVLVVLSTKSTCTYFHSAALISNY